MIRCIAVDDEKPAMDLLADNIGRVPFLQLVGKCRNTAEAYQFMVNEQVDLVFLDIQMPGITGMDWLKSLPVLPMVVLITAYEQYAVEGFAVGVTDYLVKPVPFDRFLKACHKAHEIFLQKKNTTISLPATPSRDFMFVHVEYRQVRVNFSDVVLVEGMKDYVKIHLDGLRPILTRMSMKAIEEKLPESIFQRIHKSYIVSVPRIRELKKGLVLIGEHEIPVSDHYKERLEERLGL